MTLGSPLSVFIFLLPNAIIIALIPWFIAKKRHIKNSFYIFCLSLIMGWRFIIWTKALTYALVENKPLELIGWKWTLIVWAGALIWAFAEKPAEIKNKDYVL